MYKQRHLKTPARLFFFKKTHFILIPNQMAFTCKPHIDLHTEQLDAFKD